MRLLPVAIALLFVPFIQMPVSSIQPPAGQDWIITQSTSVSDQTIWMDWNLTVKSGARLELHNVSLDFNFTETKVGGIFVEAGASLLMDRCTLNGRVNTNLYTYFVVNGSLELIDSVIYQIGIYRGISGIQLLGGNNVFRGSTFYTVDSTDTIFCNRSKLDVRDCHFENFYGRGIVAGESILDIADCTLDNCRNGILADYSSVNITGSYFSVSNLGCELHSCFARIQGCDFGDRRQAPLPAGGPLASLAPDLLIQDCEFDSCSNGIVLERYSFGLFHYGSIILHDPRETVISNDSFRFINYGIVADWSDSVLVHSNRFVTSLGYDSSVYCSGFLNDECLIDGNRFEYSAAVHVSSGSARIENNNITLNMTNYLGYSTMSCHGPVEIINNTIISTKPNNLYGIGISGLEKGTEAAISGNRIEGFRYGINVGTTPGRVLIHENNITNTSSYAISSYSESEIRDNSISRTSLGIEIRDGGYPTSYGMHIKDNQINETTRGIQAYPLSAPLNISGNIIISNISGIEVWGSSSPRINITVDGNNITANGTGIFLRAIDANPNNSSLSRNTVSDCERGIEVNSSAISPKDNRMENISEWGIYAFNTRGDFNGSVSYFNSSAPNACRLVMLWTLSLDVKCNANGPGDPEQWYSVNRFDLNARDNLGITQYDRGVNNLESLVFREYKETGNCTRVDYNPYVLTATSPKQGVGRATLVMDSAKSLELSLQKGPDLIALSLDISEQAPFEGELIFICGTAINDNTYNPNAIKVIDARLALLMDGQILTHLPVEYFSNGSQISISTAWVATPGWHNLSMAAIAPGNVTDVLPDNNVLTQRIFVARLPACRLVANGTDFDAWERVNFSIEVNSSDAVTGYRYDFGDGYVSDWILSPNVSHVFSTPGEYSVRGWVVTSRGVLRECNEPLRVRIGFPSSALELFASPDPAVSNKPVLFTARIAPGVGNVTLAIWQFGDGGYSYGKDPSVADHTYGGPGNYSVTLTLNIEGGGSLVGRLQITVLNLLPRAVARISPEKGDATTSFSFVSESQDADGRILACRWDLGDGTVVISPRVTHGYARHGVYNVTLTVQDDWGQWSDPVETVVTVDNSPPAASLRADRNSAETGKSILFSASGTSDIDDPAANLSYHWDFGDGKTADGISVSHPFSSPGRYDVKLTVDDGAGGRTTRSFTVYILGEPVGQAGWLIPALMVVAFVLTVSAVAFIAVRKRPRRPGTGIRSSANAVSSRHVRIRTTK